MYSLRIGSAIKSLGSTLCKPDTSLGRTVIVRPEGVWFRESYISTSSKVNLLLHLNTAVSTGEADNQLEFLSSILDKLSLERSFFGAVGPAKSLYHIHSTVKTTTQGYEFPSDSLPNLNTRQGKLKMPGYNYVLWFNFVHGLKFIFFLFKNNYHTLPYPKREKRKFRPRIKLNRKICYW